MQAERWEQLELTHDPFPENGPDELFLHTPALNQRLSLFAQLVRASDLTLLLLGPLGIGKSSFLQRVPSKLDETWRVVNWQARKGATEHDLLQVMSSGFAIAPGDVAAESNLESLAGHIDAMNSAGHNALLIVDDAEALSEQMLRDILHLGANSKLRIALAGQPILTQHVSSVSGNTSSGDSGLVHRITLTELNLSQSADYLRARLTRSGWTSSMPFSDQVCADIHQRSHGLPGVINQLASEFLQGPAEPHDEEPAENPTPAPDLRTAAEEVKARLATHAPIQPRITLHSGRKKPGTRTIGIIAVGLLVFAGLIFGLLRNSGEEPDADQPGEPQIADSTDRASTDNNDGLYPALPQAPAPAPAAVPANPDAPLAPGPVDLRPASTTADVVPAPELAPPPPPPDTEEATPASVDTLAPAFSGSLPKPRAAPWIRRGDAAAASSQPSSTTSPQRRRAIVIPESAPAITRPTPSPPPRARLSRPSTDAVAATEPEPVAPVSQGSWLSRSNAERYTLQLVALGSAAATDDFIVENSLNDALVVTLKTPDSKPLFAIVRGVFSSRAAAVAALQKLPPGLRKVQDVWPRRIGTLLDAALKVRSPQP